MLPSLTNFLNHQTLITTSLISPLVYVTSEDCYCLKQTVAECVV